MDIKEVIKTAMRSELEGKELYKAIAEKTDDEKAKSIFSSMSLEEESHFQILQQILKHLIKKEEYNIENIQKKVDFDNTDSPIFSNEFKNRIKDKHYEMSALSIAIKLEYDSFEFYSKAEKETEDKGLKQFFHYLSEWEKTHYDNLNKQMKFLEDDYFVQNQFAPF
jgi:rubrerythrin